MSRISSRLDAIKLVDSDKGATDMKVRPSSFAA
jgi:hypothetical protein